MKKIIFATGNKGKLRELREILAGLEVEVLSMEEAGVFQDVEETGTTFEENALLKAQAVARLTGELVLADDSGLEIDYLNGEPGIYSSRYEGKDTPYEVKHQIILKRLDGVPTEKRTARFVSAVAAVWPDGSTKVVRGTFEGAIAFQAAGCGGFGYDPIFYVPEKGCTSAELTAEEKNAMSHRGKALAAMRDLLEEYLKENR